MLFLCGILAAQEGTSIKVFVDQKEKPFTGASLTVSPEPGQIRFEVAPGSLAARAKLEGADDDWVERKDTMVFRVRFVDGKGDPVRMDAFPVSGKSPGWHGTLESSEFSPRAEQVKVPEGAQNVTFLLSSGGTQELLGVYAIRDLNVMIAAAPGKEAKALLPIDPPGGRIKGFWSKSGLRPSMAYAAESKDRPGSYHPAIRDLRLAGERPLLGHFSAAGFGVSYFKP